MYLRNQQSQRDHQDRINQPKTLDDLYLRAREHRVHNARVTFVAPETLMHLIKVCESYEKIRRLVEEHWDHAQKTQGTGYSDRDLVLWAHALGWHGKAP
jgi:hypothetical protein